MAQEENQLLNFEWDEEEFFNEETVEKKKPEETEAKKPEDKEEPEPEPKFFNEKTGEEEVEPGEVSNVFKGSFKGLKESGIFKHIDVENEEEEIDPERFLELQQEEYEIEVTERLKNWATEELDEDARAFISFKTKGGDTAEFFKALAPVAEVPVGDLKDEVYQDDIIRYNLLKEGWDAEEVEDRLEYLTKIGKKEQQALKYDQKTKKELQVLREEAVKKQEKISLEQKKQEDAFKANIKKTLESVDNIKGFPFSVVEKNKAFNFITKRELKAGNMTITPFQKKLAEIFQDPEKTILLARLVETDFDMSSFEKGVKTKHTKEIKKDLEQRKTISSSRIGSSLPGGSLADLFN